MPDETQEFSLSPSGLRTLRECEQKYVYAYRERLTAPRDEAGAAHLGSALHALLAAYWKKQSEFEQIQEFKKVWGEAEMPKWIERFRMDYDAKWREIREQCEVLAVEQELRYAGLHCIVDLVLRDPEGTLNVVEHKSTSSDITGGWATKFNLDEQLAIQLYLTRAHFGTPETKVVAGLDAIQVPRALNGKATLGYYDLSDAYNEEQLQELISGVMQSAGTAHDLQRGATEPVRNTNGCRTFNRLCIFWPLCSRPKSMREAKLAQLLASGELEPRPLDNVPEGE